MKRECASGDATVEALIANSSTFGNKTVFSQEKYKLKKQKKYAPKVLLQRPSTRRYRITLNLLESNFSQKTERMSCEVELRGFRYGDQRVNVRQRHMSHVRFGKALCDQSTVVVSGCLPRCIQINSLQRL